MEKEGFKPEATRETLTHLQRLYDEQNVRFWNIQQKLWVILGSFTIAIVTLIATQGTKIPECLRYLRLLYDLSAITVLISTFWLLYLLIPRENHAAPRLDKLYDFANIRLRFNDTLEKPPLPPAIPATKARTRT